MNWELGFSELLRKSRTKVVIMKARKRMAVMLGRNLVDLCTRFDIIEEMESLRVKRLMRRD